MNSWVAWLAILALVLTVGVFILVDPGLSPLAPCEMVSFDSGDQSNPGGTVIGGEVCRETLEQWEAEQEPVK